MTAAALTLYKYLSPDRVDVVSRGLIRYTQLGAFNDPFDGRPHIDGLSTDREAQDTLARVMPEENKRAYDSLSPEVKTLLSFKTFSEISTAFAEHKTPDVLEIMRQMTPLVRDWLHEKMDQYIGALSLSEVPDHVLMWSHYSAGHTGFAIGFRSTHEYFNGKLSDADELRHLRKVIYRDERTRAPMTSLDGTEMFFVKSTHWSYEHEWRILRPLEDAETVLEGKPFATYLFRYPRDSIVEIIFGAKILPATKQALINAIHAQPGWQYILKQALIDPRDYAIRIHEHVT